MSRHAQFRDATALTETFTCQSTNFSYSIKWRSLGSPDNPPLIFVHGTPWSSRVWAPYAFTLARHFQVYIFDNPGFGESPLGQPLSDKEGEVTEAMALDANLAEQSWVFAQLYKHWEREWQQGRKAHVVVHDHAGIMSLRAHLLHGCDYASLCLIDVVALGPFGKPLFKLVAQQRHTFEQLPSGTIRGIVQGYINDAAHHPLSPEDVEVLIGPWMTEGGTERFVRQLVAANSRSTDGLEERYGEVGKAMPVKVIWGKEDDWIPVETAERLGELLEAKEVTVLDGAGHLIMYDQSEALGMELTWWLSKVAR